MTTTKTTYTVGEVAEVAGITVRTLHHYDEIGLLEPSARTRSGYRTYDDADLATLQEILFYRELGFSLEEIREAIADPNHDRREALRRQRDLLFDRMQRVEALIGAVDRAIAAEQSGAKMTKEEMFEVFGDFDPTEHEEEVEQRWGGPLVDESRARTAGYTKDDWQAIKDEGGGILAGFAAAKRGGEPADGAVARDLAEQHRQHITRWFYECTYEVHTGLGAMYVTDARFTKFWDDAEPGLAEYVKQAIDANASRAA